LVRTGLDGPSVASPFFVTFLWYVCPFIFPISSRPVVFFPASRLLRSYFPPPFLFVCLPFFLSSIVLATAGFLEPPFVSPRRHNTAPLRPCTFFFPCVRLEPLRQCWRAYTHSVLLFEFLDGALQLCWPPSPSRRFACFFFS